MSLYASVAQLVRAGDSKSLSAWVQVPSEAPHLICKKEAMFSPLSFNLLDPPKILEGVYWIALYKTPPDNV